MLRSLGIWISSLIATLLFACVSMAQVGTPQVFFFSGKMVKGGSPIAYDQTDLSGVTNLRYGDKILETRNGMTYFTSNTELNSRTIASLIPHLTDTEWHIVAASSDPVVSAVSYYYVENGSFESTKFLYKTSGTTSTPITSCQVRDTLAIADSGGVTLWAGVSAYPTGFLIEYINGVYADEYDLVYSGVSKGIASGTTFHVLYSRPWTGFKANYTLETSYHPNIYSAVTPTLISGKYGYWASIAVTAGGSSFCLPKIQVPPIELGSTWDGYSWQFSKVAGFEKTGASEFQDYSTFVANSSQEEYMDISEWGSGGTITLSWTYKPREIHVFLPEEFKNTMAASSVSAYYWNGTNWALVPSFSDGTSHGGIALAKSGILSIPKLTDWKTRKVGQNPLDLYPIILKVSKAISNYVRIYMVRAIPDYDSPSSVWMCRGVMAAHNRLWLYNGRNKSHIYVSAENQPDCFTGSDSRDGVKPIIVGKQEDVIWAGAVGGKVVILKKTQNWLIDGINPDTFKVYEMPGTAACIAPKSVQVVGKEGLSFVVYMTMGGVFAIKVSSDNDISNPCLSNDIPNYWTPQSGMEFSATDLTNAQSWYSETTQEYHLIVGMTELVYSVRFGKWTTFDRGNHPIGCGLYMTDPNRNRIEIGGGKTGRIYTLESGTLDYADVIQSDIERPDVFLGTAPDKRFELMGVALRYERKTGTALAGCSAYLTPSLTSGATTYQAGFTLASNGFTYLPLLNWRTTDGVKGFTHKRRYRFPGQVKLFQEIVWSQEAPWPQ